MTTADSTEEGLRARKKRQTRRDIVTATLELSLEHSYRATTIAMIAERAMVSPRTVSTYFPNKDEIPNDGSEETLERLARRLAEKEVPLIERLRLWIADQVADHDEELILLLLRASSKDPDLRLAEHRNLDRLSDLVASAVAEELGLEVDAAGPQAFATGFTGVLLAIRRRMASEESSATLEDDLESGFRFLEAGLASLRADAAAI